LIYLYLFLIISLATICGLFLGARLARPTYAGEIVITETPDGIKFGLELAGDPENLITEHHVVFLVVPPDYQKLLSQ